MAGSFYGERYSASEMVAGMPDFPALAKAFGVRGSDHRALQGLMNNWLKAFPIQVPS